MYMDTWKFCPYCGGSIVANECTRCHRRYGIQMSPPDDVQTRLTQTLKEKPCRVQQAFDEARRRGEKNPVISIYCDCPRCRIQC